MKSIDSDETELRMKFRDGELDDDFARNGGSVGHVEFSSLILDSYSKTDPEVMTGSFDISFSESYYNGCKDSAWKIPWSGSGSVLIERSTGQMTVEIEAERVPEPVDDDEG
jgi:hypothetical protein